MLPLLLALIVPAQAAEPSGVARIGRDAEALAPLLKTDLARAFVKAGTSLPDVRPRTVYFDRDKKAYLTEGAARRLDDAGRAKLKTMTVDESFFYNTRYGSPLAYARPMELLGRDGLEGLKGRKALDFGCGGVGPLRMMAVLGAEAVGLDVDPMLEALYSEPGDVGDFQGGRVSLVIGRYPADKATAEKVGGGYDLILSKNTLKRGYVHPESGRAFIDLGGSDVSFLKTLHAALKPGGRVLIYNLAPAPSPPGQPYKAMADGRCPFSRADWEAAGFRVDALDRDDSDAARQVGVALGWDKGMDLAKDLFATYTLARKP